MTPRLKEIYIKEIQPSLKEKFGLKNTYMSPKLQKKLRLKNNHETKT